LNKEPVIPAKRGAEAALPNAKIALVAVLFLFLILVPFNEPGKAILGFSATCASDYSTHNTRSEGTYSFCRHA
jgi:hypothetical protein